MRVAYAESMCDPTQYLPLAKAAEEAEAREVSEKKSSKPKRSSSRQSPTEAAVKSFLRSMSTTLGREIMRGILGVIKKS